VKGQKRQTPKHIRKLGKSTDYVVHLCCSIEAAVSVFRQMRPPGIYKQDYLYELFSRYGERDDTPSAPPLPDWCLGQCPVEISDDSIIGF